jgi:hypothetical protein
MIDFRASPAANIPIVSRAELGFSLNGRAKLDTVIH